MVWFFPDKIHWWNYLPMIPAFLGTFLVFPRLARGWRITIYRVCTIISVCHALAVTDALRQRVAAWVPTGAAKQEKSRSFSTPKKAALLLRAWIIVVQLLLWIGIARAAIHFPISYWGYLPAAALGLLQLYMLAPFLRRLDPRPLRAEHHRTPDLVARDELQPLAPARHRTAGDRGQVPIPRPETTR